MSQASILEEEEEGDRPPLKCKKITREKANSQNHNSWEGSW